jgi:hypothetical protein
VPLLPVNPEITGRINPTNTSKPKYVCNLKSTLRYVYSESNPKQADKTKPNGSQANLGRQQNDRCWLKGKPWVGRWS